MFEFSQPQEKVVVGCFDDFLVDTIGNIHFAWAKGGGP